MRRFFLSTAGRGMLAGKVLPIVFFFVLCATAWGSGAVSFLSKDGRELCTFKVELSVTPAEHSRGLMFRQSLSENAGMLFVFRDESLRDFWMKNTVIPLDIIFMGSKRDVVGIHCYAKPRDESIISSGSPAKYVLEINGGKADRCGIRLDSKVEFTGIPQR
jgi:uncharacterized protein